MFYSGNVLFIITNFFARNLFHMTIDFSHNKTYTKCDI